VHKPGAAMARLTPANCAELLFDDVIWVKQARIEHMTFVDAMRNRGVEVVFLRQLLMETLKDMDARKWLLEARISDNTVGVGLADDLMAHLMEVDADLLSTILIGGMSRAELPIPDKGVLAPMLEPADFILPPLPNHIFTRDTTCWIYGGVTLNPMHWPARRLETLNLAAIYRFHPDFRDAGFPVWWGDPMADHGPATVEGGDVMPIGGGCVLIGMGERTTPQAVSQIARGLFKGGGATRVIACQFPRARGSMHLDTVFTFCDRDLVTIFAEVTDAIRCYSLRPGEGEDIAVEAETNRFWRSWPTLLASGNCAPCPPAAMPTRPRANNGTMPTICSVSSPGLSLDTSGTSIPTRFCARRVSRSSPSPDRNLDVGAVDHTA
jgi:arginine deiminase